MAGTRAVRQNIQDEREWEREEARTRANRDRRYREQKALAEEERVGGSQFQAGRRFSIESTPRSGGGSAPPAKKKLAISEEALQRMVDREIRARAKKDESPLVPKPAPDAEMEPEIPMGKRFGDLKIRPLEPEKPKLEMAGAVPAVPPATKEAFRDFPEGEGFAREEPYVKPKAPPPEDERMGPAFGREPGFSGGSPKPPADERSGPAFGKEASFTEGAAPEKKKKPSRLRRMVNALR